MITKECLVGITLKALSDKEMKLKMEEEKREAAEDGDVSAIIDKFSNESEKRARAGFLTQPVMQLQRCNEYIHERCVHYSDYFYPSNLRGVAKRVFDALEKQYGLKCFIVSSVISDVSPLTENSWLLVARWD